MLRSTTVTVLAVAAVALSGCDWFMSDQERLDKAKALVDRGEYGDASIELKKLLQSSDRTPSARALLGQALLAMGQPQDAEAQLNKAREAGVPPDDYAVELATAFFLQGKHDQIVSDFENLELADAGDIARMNVIRGKALLAKGEPERAAAAFNAALQAVPGSPDARVGLALVDAAEQRTDRAGGRLDGVLKEYPGFAEALLVKGQFALRDGRNRDAEAAFEQIETGGGERPATSGLIELQAMVGLAEARYRQHNLDGAEESVAALAKRFPGHPLTAYMQGLIDYANGDYKAAISHLSVLTQSGAAMPGVYFLAGASHYALGNLEQAQMFLSGAVDQAPDDANARKMLALTEMRLGRPDRADQVVQSLVDSGAEDSGQMWRALGGLSLRQGDVDSGLNYLERGSDGGDPAVTMDLAAAYIASGRADSGLEVLSRLPDTLQGEPRRDMLEVLALVKEGDLETARTRTEELVKGNPEDFQAHSLAGSVNMVAGHLTRAREHYEKAHEIDPDKPAGRTNLARLAVAQGDTASATAHLNAVLEDSPGYEAAALMFARIRIQAGDVDGAAAVLEKALEAGPDSDRLRTILARLYLAGNRLDKAAALAEAALQRRPDRDFYVRTLVEVRLRQGRFDQAETFLQQRIQADPDAVRPLLYLARVQSAAGRYDDARRQLEQALTLETDEAAVRFEMARLAAVAGDYKRALSTLNEVREEQPESAVAYDLEGELYARQKQFDKARAAFSRAADIHPSRQRLGRLLQIEAQVGVEPDIARLQAWVEQHPNDAEAMVMLAQHVQERRGGEQAAPVYEKALAVDPDNIVALNNLAWFYAEQGDERAVTLAERAYELAPRSGGIVDTYGWALAQLGRHKEAVVHLREAAELEPDVPDIRFHLVQALHAAGKSREARDILAHLLKSGQSFSERREAEALYQELR